MDGVEAWVFGGCGDAVFYDVFVEWLNGEDVADAAFELFVFGESDESAALFF